MRCINIGKAVPQKIVALVTSYQGHKEERRYKLREKKSKPSN